MEEARKKNWNWMLLRKLVQAKMLDADVVAT
jgi:hypothetical protein